MKRFIKHVVGILLVIPFVLLCSGCDSDPGNRTVVRDADKYMQVSNYVAAELRLTFSGILPPNDVVEHGSAEYYYSYDHPVFYNPSFVIYLNNKFADSTAFSREKERIIGISDGTGIIYRRRSV